VIAGYKRGVIFATAALRGALAGLAGAATMTLGEKLEQQLSGRPNSYVPAHTLAHLLGMSSPDDPPAPSSSAARPALSRRLKGFA
jgi:hypothetical protein